MALFYWILAGLNSLNCASVRLPATFALIGGGGGINPRNAKVAVSVTFAMVEGQNDHTS